MPKRAKPLSIYPAAVQLPLFPDAASLIRVRPERNEWRFYRMEVWPDLFGRALLVRKWGRIGTEGRRRLDPHPDPGAAINALARLAGRKRRRRDGIYRAVPVPPVLLEALDLVHGVRELQSRRGKGRGILLWPWSRMTGWRAVHAVMEAAGPAA
jgi:predicted DNA-binding WGR domain protein